MNYKDYFDWAQEYRTQAEILNKKLEDRKKSKKIMTPEQTKEFDSATRMLYEMRLECTKTMVILENKAKEIKEREDYEKRNALI